jgi:glycine dehydrogenase subunit 1
VSELVDPRYVEVLQTNGRASGIEVDRFPSGEDGRSVAPDVGDDIAAVVLQHPNHHGVLEDARAVFEAASGGGARAIQIFDPLSLGVLAPPGELGADVVYGNSQRFGVPLGYGGPHAAFFATLEKHVRQAPGRIIGVSIDSHGNTAYRMSLQTREQHIRREKATSNICTSQALNALAGAVYLSWLGRRGIVELGELMMRRTAYARERLGALEGVEQLHAQPVVREFGVRLAAPVDSVLRRCAERSVNAGYALGQTYPEHDDGLLVAITERTSRAEIDRLAEVLEEAVAAERPREPEAVGA